MKKMISAVLFVVVAVTGFAGLPGCGDKRAKPVRAGNDRIIQHYMQRRSDLVGQRRRLAATYGANSPQVAEIDRQIALVDEAATQRRNQLIQDDQARQQLQQMKEQATPSPETSTPAATRPVR